MYGPQDLWHHVDCFVTKRDDLEFDESMDPTKLVYHLKYQELLIHDVILVLRLLPDLRPFHMQNNLLRCPVREK